MRLQAGCLDILCTTSSQVPVSNVILAMTMLTQRKADQDRQEGCRLIAQRLCYGGYNPVYIPTGEDDAVKDISVCG